mmetsp:Transcript_41183/g.98813  ORF Transcript_41183/g.98813 Transcript_41183/m.98813 type:complete len:146 (+) Transcript_41183:1060-1497(+)
MAGSLHPLPLPHERETSERRKICDQAVAQLHIACFVFVCSELPAFPLLAAPARVQRRDSCSCTATMQALGGSIRAFVGFYLPVSSAFGITALWDLWDCRAYPRGIFVCQSPFIATLIVEVAGCPTTLPCASSWPRVCGVTQPSLE